MPKLSAGQKRVKVKGNEQIIRGDFSVTRKCNFTGLVARFGSLAKHGLSVTTRSADIRTIGQTTKKVPILILKILLNCR